MAEDLYSNKFFLAVKNEYLSIYQDVSKNCWLLAVPTNDSFNGQAITESVVKCHVLKPTNFDGIFMGAYDPSRVVGIKENEIQTRTGYAQKRTATIIIEELFYNEEYKSFRVLLLDRALEGGSEPQKTKLSQITSIQTLSECCTLLKAYPENELVLKKFDQHIDEFNTTYLIPEVSGYETYVVEKVKAMCEDAVEQLLCANIDFRNLQDNAKQLTAIELIIESYMIGGIYDKLFGSLCRILQKKDGELSYAVQEMQRKSQQDLGISGNLQFEYKSSQRAMEKIAQSKTPLEKIHFLQKAIEAINETIEQNAKGDVAITTDDLLPILVFIVIKTNVPNLHTHLFIMKNCIFTDISMSEMGFHIISISAAAEFITMSASSKNDGSKTARMKRKKILTNFQKEYEAVTPDARNISLSSIGGHRPPTTTKKNLSSWFGRQTSPKNISLSPDEVDEDFQKPPEVIAVSESKKIVTRDSLSHLKSLTKDSVARDVAKGFVWSPN